MVLLSSWHIATLILCGAVWLTTAQEGAAASFDCRKASTKEERLICADSALSALDEQMTVAFRQAQRRSNDKGKLLADQRDWLSTRKMCLLKGDQTAQTGCMRQATDERMLELLGMAASAERSNGVKANLAPLLTAEKSCQIADMLFGSVRLDVIKYDGYETAIVRSATFDEPSKNYGALLGEITVDRGGFSVRNPNQVVIGVIGPDLQIEGWDDVCDKKTLVEIVAVKKQTYVILAGGKLVGTIEGRFPENGFGVK